MFGGVKTSNTWTLSCELKHPRPSGSGIHPVGEETPMAVSWHRTVRPPLVTRRMVALVGRMVRP